MLSRPASGGSGPLWVRVLLFGAAYIEAGPGLALFWVLSCSQLQPRLALQRLEQLCKEDPRGPSEGKHKMSQRPT